MFMNVKLSNALMGGNPDSHKKANINRCVCKVYASM